MNNSIKARLAKLQQEGDSFPDVLRWIAEGRIYGELADAERARYAAYWNTTPRVLEELELAATGTLHKPLERRPKPPTQEEHREIIKELESVGQYDDRRQLLQRARRQRQPASYSRRNA